HGGLVRIGRREALVVQPVAAQVGDLGGQAPQRLHGGGADGRLGGGAYPAGEHVGGEIGGDQGALGDRRGVGDHRAAPPGQVGQELGGGGAGVHQHGGVRIVREQRGGGLGDAALGPDVRHPA